jgi:hypothetical protein
MTAASLGCQTAILTPETRYHLLNVCNAAISGLAKGVRMMGCANLMMGALVRNRRQALSQPPLRPNRGLRAPRTITGVGDHSTMPQQKDVAQ